MFVFVLLYNAHTNNEGIHTLKYGEGRNAVLMFESGVGANYYASLLEAYGFPKPTAELLDEEEVRKFCLNSGYDCQFIPADHVAIPPQNHANSSFWELSSSNLSSKQKEYYLASLRETYFLYKRSIVDLQQERARRGFSVEINRQIEYYIEELQKIEIEIQRWA
jgi:hypothetical protein